MSVRQISSDVDSFAKNPRREHLQLTSSTAGLLPRGSSLRAKKQHRTEVCNVFGSSSGFELNVLSMSLVETFAARKMEAASKQSWGKQRCEGVGSILFFPPAFASRTSTKLSDLRSQSSYLSSVLQPTGIQPNQYQDSNDTQATSRKWFAVNFGQLKNKKHMSGFGKKSNNACSMSVRPLLCIISRKPLSRFASNLPFLKTNNTLLAQALARITKANQIAKGCQFTNSANLKRDRSETITIV